MIFYNIEIIQLLNQPRIVREWNATNWESLLEQAYHTGLVARVFYLLNENELTGYIPANLYWHFISAWKLFLAHESDIKKEVAQINGILSVINTKAVYLKGTAYLEEGLICSKGRIFSDVDVFVPKAKLAQAENILKWQGWTLKELDEHDQHYYREWMHELPPMVNTKSGLTLDLHHNLIPIISRIKLDSDALFENCLEREVSMSLSNEDKVLHSAAHLLLDGEFNHGFRDLHDIYLMIQEFNAAENGFINRLIKRSQALNFEFILYHCLKLQQRLFSIELDEDIFNTLIKNKLSRAKANFIVSLFEHVLNPLPKKTFLYNLSSFLLYIRSHWLKMPLKILIPHLFYKSIIAPFNKSIEKEV